MEHTERLGDAHTKPSPRLDAATARRLAVQASCDPRTLVRILAGEPVKGLAGERARAALIKAGYTLPEVQP